MDLGVYKSFTTEDEEEGLLDILKNLESRSDVKSVKIKSGNAKQSYIWLYQIKDLKLRIF